MTLPLKNDAKKGNPQLGNIILEFEWQPDPNSEGIDGLRDPPVFYEGDLFLRVKEIHSLP